MSERHELLQAAERRGRRHLFALLFLAAIAITPFAVPLLRGEVFTIRDHFDYIQPLRWFTAMELKAGRLPLWNPYNAFGEPWLANPQSGVFYPPAWLFLVLPFSAAYMLFLLLHVVLLGWGAYLLFARTKSEGAAIVGGAALMFCGPVLSLLDVANNLQTLAWIPLALWCAAEGAWRRGALVLTMAFFGGEPFFAALTALLYVIVTFSGEERVSGPRPVTRIVSTGVLAFGLSAVQLLPFLDLVRSSDRAGGGFEASQILYDSMPAGDWLRIAVPPHLDALGVDPKLGQHFIPVVYMGAIVCVLAAIGVAVSLWRIGKGRWREAKPELGWMLVLLFAVVVSTGPLLVARLPLTLFRYPSRLVPIGAIAIAALAAAGWDRVRAGRRWLDLVVVLLVILDLTPRSRPLLRSEPFRTDVVPYPRSVGASSMFLRVGTIDARERTAWISGYVNLYERRLDAYTAAPLAMDRYVRMYRRLLEKPTREELARRGVGWILTTHELGSAFTAVAKQGSVALYRNPTAMPMAALFTREPLTAHAMEARFDTSHVRVTVNAAQEGVLVLLQQSAPGWRVSIDGVEARSLEVDTLFRGVQLTKGHHEVVWTYHPLPFFAGAAITIFALMSMTLSGFVKRAR